MDAAMDVLKQVGAWANQATKAQRTMNNILNTGTKIVNTVSRGDAKPGGGGGGGNHQGGTSGKMQHAPPEFDPEATTSKHWGVNGELWDPRGKFADWSYAGAWMGEKQVPPPNPPTHDLVRDFGANGQDDSSDADALQKAISSMKNGDVLYIPPGRYVIDKKVVINKGITIRGAGRDATTLYFPKSLSDLKPWTPTPANPKSPYSDGPCFLTFDGYLTLNDSSRLAYVVAPAQRGNTSILVKFAPNQKVGPGSVVRIVASDQGGKLVDYLYGGLTAKDWGHPSKLIGCNNLIKFHTPVGSVTPGPDPDTWQLELKRPLAYDLRPGEWRGVEVHTFKNALYFSGLSDVTLEFPPTLYPGHFMERGFNALEVRGCVHHWLTGLRIINHDLGISIYNSVFCTVRDVILGTTINRSNGGPFSNHHQIRMAHSQDCCAKDIVLGTRSAHDISFDHMPALNVYHNVSGPDLCLDFHGDAPTNNLHSRVNCGAATRPWNSGGSGDSGGHAGIGNVMWGGPMGCQPHTCVPPMPRNFAPRYTAVGYCCRPDATFYNDFELERVDPQRLQPWDLHAAMLERRLATGHRQYK